MLRSRMLRRTTLVLTGVVGIVAYGYVAKPGWMGVADKTLWDWLQLLLVPLLLAGGGFLLNSRTQQYREERAQEFQQQLEEIRMNQQAQHESLRTYLDRMNQLIIDGHLFEEPEDSHVRRLAQAWTVHTLVGLDKDRKRPALSMLYELQLISKDNPIISLNNAALETAQLMEMSLHDACLRGVDLRVANLRRTDLKGSDLSQVDLRGADLSDADLSDACLAGANLLPYDERHYTPTHNLVSGGVATWYDVDLSEVEAYWRGDYSAPLHPTNLENANLSGADLTGSYLTGTNITTKQLAACKSLKGTTMPNGQKYEDWLESREEGGEG
jgi:uncharacterized protein YjbI with pentapeptide repeats